MADKKKKNIVPEEATKQIVETLIPDLEAIEAEMRLLSPTLPDLKKNNPAKYKEVYRRYMWLIGERDRLKGTP